MIRFAAWTAAETSNAPYHVGSRPASNTWFLVSNESAFKQHLDRFRAHEHDQQTDHATPSVVIGRI